jgi:putative tricarboxylic transport membrane protein
MLDNTSDKTSSRATLSDMPINDTPKRRVDRAGIVIALLLAGIATVLAWDASTVQSNTLYGMGPQAMPFVIALGLGVLAIGNLIEAWRGLLPRREDADLKAVLLILSGLALLIGIIAIGGGFILATTALFVATSSAFGRRAILSDFTAGFVLTTLIYLMFDRLLTLSLPAGPLERLL